MSGVYLGLMMFAQLPPPYNEGLYRCVSVDLGHKGSLCNAEEPAPHVNCTTTPMETLTDAVRKALEQAAPERVAASWGHASGINIAGIDPRTGEQYVTMVLASIISGAGATRVMDGWHACGPLCCFGALSSGDTELLEYAYPIIIRRYGLVQDSGGAGMYRGGSGTVWEVEPIDHDMTVVAFGEGRQIPTMGAAGARNRMTDPKLGRLVLQADSTEVHRKNTIFTVKPGAAAGQLQSRRWRLRRSVAAPARSGIAGLPQWSGFSGSGGCKEYGVVIDARTLSINTAATDTLRHQASHSSK